MKLHPYIPPINATVRTIDGLIGTVERVDVNREVYTWMGDGSYAILGPWTGEVWLRLPDGPTPVSIYNIRPCIRE